MKESDNGLIERLLTTPYRVIDFLPRRVPDGGEGQFFAAEKFFRERCGAELRKKFADILLKLNCYYSFEVFADYSDEGVRDPAPEELAELILGNETALNVLIGSEDVLITLDTDDTGMTVYNAKEEFLDLTGQIASSCGMFLWR